jgi:hypothetical protein
MPAGHATPFSRISRRAARRCGFLLNTKVVCDSFGKSENLLLFETAT